MIKLSICLFLAALSFGKAATAQSKPIWDGKLDYRARENTAGFDNDVFTLDLGYTRFSDRGNGAERGFRMEGFAGHHNTHPFVGARFQLFEQTETRQYGAALSLDSIIGENSGVDIAVTGARFWDRWSLYGHAGVQYVTDASTMDGKSFAPIASLRGYFYPLDTTALSFGASIDGDDPLVHVGVEYQQADAFNGIFFEWVVGPNGYRGEDFYNTLRIGLRASNFDGLLKARQRKSGDISYVRALDSR